MPVENLNNYKNNAVDLINNLETEQTGQAVRISDLETEQTAQAVRISDLETGQPDLSAIAETKGVTAVDVFVYDTSLDSDGGAWRKRTQHTSWYNEALNTTTRGARREFPAVAVIVVEADKITIYDADDPALPMWMSFVAGNGLALAMSGDPNSVVAKDGEIFCATDTRLARVSFPSDRVRFNNANGLAGRKGGVSNRNGSDGYLLDASQDIALGAVHDVAITVLPDAPIDPATGLPVPTIAVATDNGVSVIKDDGTVADSATTNAAGQVAFAENGLWFSTSTGTRLWYDKYANLTSDGFASAQVGDTDGSSGDFVSVASLESLASAENTLFVAGDGAIELAKAGLMLHQPNYTDQSEGMSALLTSTYNTGWMHGDIKGAFLADTDDTDLVGYTAIDDDGSSATGWSDARGNGTVTSTGGRIRSTATAAGAYGPVKTLTGLVVGKRYVYSADVFTGGGSGAFYFRITAVSDLNDTNTVNVGSSSDFSPSATFTATNSTMYVGAIHSAAAGGDYAEIDNISLKLADEDRSVNSNGLIINGTVTRDAVATGADLVAYSGFTASNYLEQPYNPDLDFGTGDFCLMGWVKDTGSINDLLDRSDASNTLRVKFSSSKVRVNIDGVNLDTPNTLTGGWRHITYVRKSGIGYIYGDGALLVSGSHSGNIGTGVPVRIGNRYDGTAPYEGSMALWRISATAPTPEQIRKIYEDEKFLFQENAQATLYGSSDAVTALAHDPVTDLLHVGTSAGRSVFQGLRRVDNTTDAVGTAISGSNNLIMEE